jgi:hypothetical protein
LIPYVECEPAELVDGRNAVRFQHGLDSTSSGRIRRGASMARWKKA